MTTVEANYQRHIEELERSGIGEPVVISAPDTIDAYNHERQFAGVDAIVAADPAARWLTIGDSGADVTLAFRAGARSIIASNITSHSLNALAAQGKLPPCEVRALNAEALELPEGGVDYVLCRQAFHHFPRPMIGFYEMWRVARRGVILIEPGDIMPPRPLENVRAMAKKVLRGQSGDETLFEADAANFIYRLSLVEAWKAAVALQADAFFERRFNHLYLAPVSGAKRSDVVWRGLYSLAIGLQDGLCAAGLMNWGMGGAILLKSGAKPELARALGRVGWRERRVPRNPFLDKPSAPAVG